MAWSISLAITPSILKSIGIEGGIFYLLIIMLNIVIGLTTFIWHVKLKRRPRKNIYIFFAVWAIGLILFLLRADQNGILLLLSQLFYGAYAISDALDMAVGLSSRAKTAIAVSHLLSLIFASTPIFITTLVVLYRKKKRTSVNARMKGS
jgi:hypothetical protein